MKKPFRNYPWLLVPTVLLSTLVMVPGCKDHKSAEGLLVKDGPEIFVQLGHSESIGSVCFSPDGVYTLSGSADHTVKLWEIRTGRLVRTIYGKDLGIRGEGGITGAFSPDGRFLLLGSWDGDIVVLELGTGRKISGFILPAMSCMLWSPDGAYAFAGSYDGTMKLWSTATGDEEESFEHESPGASAAAYSADGKSILVGDQGGGLALLDVATAKPTKIFRDEAETSTIFGVSLSRDGTRAIAANSAGNIMVWDTRSGNKIRQFATGGILNNHAVAFSPDGKSVVLPCTQMDTLHLWDIESGEHLATFAGDDGNVNAVAFSRDGALLVSGSSDKTVRLWNAETGELWKSFVGLRRYATAASLSPDGATLLSANVQWFGNQDITVNVWDAGHGQLTRQIKGKSSYDIAFTPDCRSLLTLGAVWDVGSGEKTRDLFGTKYEMVSAISRDGRYALSGVREGTVTLRDFVTSEQLLSVKAHAMSLSALAFSPDGRYFGTGCEANEDNLKVWDLHTGQLIRTFDKSTEFISAIAFTPDGKYLLSGNPSTNAILRLWDISTGEVARTFAGHTNDVYAVAISADGKYILSGGRDATVRLWDLATGEIVKNFAGHAGNVKAVSFAANGKQAVSASDDGSTRLWNLATGEEIAEFIGFEDGEWVVMTPSGYFNASSQGAQHLNVRFGNAVYSVDNFYEKFYNPAYIASILGGKEVQPVADIRKGILAPPRVRFLSPEPNTQRTSDTITIAISAKDMTGGIDEIRLYQNGKAIGEETRGMKPVAGTKEQVRTFTASLVDGKNVFRATGFSTDRTESNPIELVVTLSAPQQEVSLHVVAVGINGYKNPALNLNYAEPDAKGIADFFRRGGHGLFMSVDIRELFNERATKENILTALRELSGCKPQDAVVIYLAGHGETIQDQWYFIPHEVTYPEREEEVKSKAISSDELRRYVNGIKAQKVLMLLDACKSGGVMVAFRGFEDRKALSQLSRAAGVHVVAASTSNQLAAEVKELGHGVFTYTLLAGLNGKAAGATGTVTVRKLLGYLEETLPEITKKYRQEAQFPVVDSRGMDFPLVISK
jgi:WD40 repeat protein